jgi:hypothetical protein
MNTTRFGGAVAVVSASWCPDQTELQLDSSQPPRPCQTMYNSVDLEPQPEHTTLLAAQGSSFCLPNCPDSLQLAADKQCSRPSEKSGPPGSRQACCGVPSRYSGMTAECLEQKKSPAAAPSFRPPVQFSTGGEGEGVCLPVLLMTVCVSVGS